MTFLVKDPASRIDCEFDWASAYSGGQAVMASDWTVVPDEAGGVTAVAMAFDLLRATVTLAGGVAGRVYRVSNRVTLSDGQIDERSMDIRVEER